MRSRDKDILHWVDSYFDEDSEGRVEDGIEVCVGLVETMSEVALAGQAKESPGYTWRKLVLHAEIAMMLRLGKRSASLLNI